MKRYQWEARKKHAEDLELAHHRTGILSEKMGVIRFNGPAFHEMFNRLGHDKGSFEDCICNAPFRNAPMEVTYGMVNRYVEV